MNKVLIGMLMLAFVVRGTEIKPNGTSDIASANPLNTYMENLRSEDLKALCVKYYPLMGDLDPAKARPAIDFYYDLKCTDILALALLNKNYEIKIYVLDAIYDLAEEGDRDVAQVLVAELDRAIGSLNSGGSEVQEPFRIYKKLLVGTLVKLSRVDAGNIDMKSDQSLRDFISQVQGWLDSK